MKKSKDLGKKIEGKEYIKKSDNLTWKRHVKKVNDKIVEKKEKAKSTIKNEVIKTKSDIDNVIDHWNHPDIPIYLSLTDEQVYNNIQNTILRENKRNHHIFTPDLLSFTKQYYVKNIMALNIYIMSKTLWHTL